MNLYYKNLSIRNALEGDSQQLCRWWNDGRIMAHAGFPSGLGIEPEEIKKSLAEDSNTSYRRHIIELDGKAIGETSYRNMGNCVAEIGIKICDESKQNKGYGSILLSIFIDALFRYYGMKCIILDTNAKNTRAQHVYEDKLHFKRKGTRDNSWQDTLGIWQSSIDYELQKEDWYKGYSENYQYIHIRNEQPSDYYAVESLTRDAFWKNSRHICDEHLLVSKLRNSCSFVAELDFVAEINGMIVGHIIYSHSYIEGNDGNRYDTLTFGPISVLPAWQYMGVGKALLKHSITEAKRLNYRAIIIYGHPDYYPRVGFKRAKEYGITTPEGNTFDPLMALPLYDTALLGCSGRYYISRVYYELPEHEVLAFEGRFPLKEKYQPIPITVITERLKEKAAKAFITLGINYLDELTSKSEGLLLRIKGIDRNDIEIIKEVMKEYSFRWGERR